MPEPVLEPMPVLPEPELVPAPVPLVLGEVELGEEVEPLLELGEVELEDEEPLAAPCSCRQRSFSDPVRASHWVLLAPTEGELEVLPPMLGEVVLLLEPPLAAEPVLELPLAPDDESAAIATAEAANKAANVAVESTFNIVLLLMKVQRGLRGK